MIDKLQYSKINNNKQQTMTTTEDTEVLQAANEGELFPFFPGPPDVIFRTFEDQSHFPGLSRDWKFDKKKHKRYYGPGRECVQQLLTPGHCTHAELTSSSGHASASCYSCCMHSHGLC